MIKAKSWGRWFALLAFISASAPALWAEAVQAQPVTAGEAKVLSFPSGAFNQAAVVSLTADSRTLQTGYVQATYDPVDGVVVEVDPAGGQYSVGFGSYVPGNYTGAGALYLYRVLITDQNGATIVDEPFDGWAQSSTATVGNTTRSVYTTTAGNSWATFEDAASIYTGYGAEFSVKDTGGDKGFVYPIDGAGPFSVLSRTVVNVPPGTTELRINVDWGYQVNNTAAARTFTIGVRPGDVAAESLFSFSAPAPAAVPTMSEWAMILFATLLAGAAALGIHRRRTAF